MRFLSYLSSIFILILVVACGGGGGSAGTSTSTGTGTATFSVNAPSSLALGEGAVTSYQLIGGTAPYSVGSSDTRVVTATISGTTLTINAVKFGSATLVILDAAGKSISLTATVNLAVEGTFSVNAPSSLALGEGAVTTYQVVGGTAPYSVGSSDTRVVIATISGTTLTISAVKSGSASLVILDATGKSISLTATVTLNGASSENTPSTIEILPSNSFLSSASGSTVSFAVTVKNASNVTIPSQTITFVASSGNLTGANPAPVTGLNGTNTSVALSPGLDATNRQITVTVTADRVSKAVVIPVSGTTVSVSGAGSTLLGAVPPTYSFKAADSAGKPIKGALLTVSSSLGNKLSFSSVTTDSSGVATVIYTPTIVGTDTLLVSGLGTTGQTAVIVSNEDFSFLNPAPGLSLAVSTTATATVSYKVSGVPQVGKSVFFSTTRGTVASGPVVTDANGLAATTFSSATAGPVTLSAQIGSSRTTVTNNFVSTTPATLFLQANPNAILPNTGAGSTNQSTLLATVRDAVGNPVVNQVVNFTALQDLSNGYISPGSAATDTSGVASSQFVSGPLSTPANGVTLQASVQGTAIANTATLTVNGSALFISIGLANVLDVVDKVTYGQTFSVYVTDANGAAAGNRAVTLSLYPPVYRKGAWAYNAQSVPPGWVTPVALPPGSNAYVLANPHTECVNEDRNRNGILNAGEDTNGDGILWPGIPVVLNPTTLVTDEKGYATFQATWGKNYGTWATVDITAKSTVNGTESRKDLSYSLRVAQADVETTATPPFVVSPFGVGTDCTNAR